MSQQHHRHDLEAVCTGCRAPFVIMGGKLGTPPVAPLCAQCAQIAEQGVGKGLITDDDPMATAEVFRLPGVG